MLRPFGMVLMNAAGAAGAGGTVAPLTGEGVNTPPPVAAVVPPVVEPPKSAAVTFETTEQLNERLARHHKAQLKKHGLESDDDLQKLIAERDARAAKDAEAARAQMTREQQLEADKKAAEEARDAAQAALEDARFNEHVTGICAGLGIKNLTYAKFLVAAKADETPDGQQVDAAAYLAEQLADPATAAAFGVTPPAKPVTGVVVPGQTGNQVTPPTPPPAGGSGKVFDAMTATAEEWAAHKRALNIG